MAERTQAKRRAAPAAGSNTTPGTAAATTATDAPVGGERATAAQPSRSRKSGGAAEAGAAKAGTSQATSRMGGGKVATKKAAPTRAPKSGRSAAETDRIRAALAARRDELREEYTLHLAEIAELQRDRLTDSAGDDQADTGSKAFEREQELSLAHSILERTSQVERALERLDEGNYGWCERCSDPIPVERLAAFPSATLCVSCKQLEERR